MIKGAVFDVDGTLLDSMPAWFDMGNKYLEKFKIDAEENLSLKLFAMSIHDGAQYLIDRYHLNKTREQVISELVAPVYSFYSDEAPFKPGAGEFLDKLRRLNIPMAVATAGDKRYLHAPFKRLGIEDYFKCVYTCTQFDTNKNEPTIYLNAARELGTSPEETYVFEDSYPAAQTAKNAGFRVVGVYDETYNFMMDRLKAVSDFFIEDYSQLDINKM